jgi:ADP-ribosylglycohydrolase
MREHFQLFLAYKEKSHSGGCAKFPLINQEGASTRNRTMVNSTTRQRASGSLFGLAFGDALGARTEFLSFNEILRSFPPDGPLEPPGNPALVTDDKQMTLALGKALLKAARPYSAATLAEPLKEAFIEWNESPENNRAPGRTCMDACNRLAQGLDWQKATIMNSKGCGANMRVAPVGLIPADEDGVTEETRAALAQFQAAFTHGHPTGLAAADLTAWAIADLVAGHEPSSLPRRLQTYALTQRNHYHETWLGPLWQQILIFDTPEEYIAHGWNECLHVLERLEQALQIKDRITDPCLQTGAGWIAEEAMATGLLCFLLYPDDPVAAIRHAAVSSGDSDSLACLTGAFAGAYHGLAAWPAEWLTRIEYREQLTTLGAAWDR